MFLMQFLIDEIRIKLPKEAPKYRNQLLNLARWIAERFGFKLVKIKDESKITNPIVTTISSNRVSTRLPKDVIQWRNRFLEKATRLRINDPERYHQRLNEQRVN